jgi:hypothetical protein
MSLPSFDTNKIMANVSKTNRILISVAAIIGAITVIGGGYSYYVNNFYIPTIKVISIDFAKGVAKVQHRNKVIDIYGDAIFNISISNNWGVKFGMNKGSYESLQLVKNGMVVQYLKNNSL